MSKKKSKAARKHKHLTQQKTAALTETAVNAPPTEDKNNDGSSSAVPEPELQAPSTENLQEVILQNEAESNNKAVTTAAVADISAVKQDSPDSVDADSSAEESMSPAVPSSEEAEPKESVSDTLSHEETAEGKPLPGVLSERLESVEDAVSETSSDEISSDRTEDSSSAAEKPQEKEQVQEDKPVREPEKHEDSGGVQETEKSEKTEESCKREKSKETKKSKEQKEPGKISPLKRVLTYAAFILALGFAFLASNYLLLTMCYGTVSVNNGDAYNSNNVGISMYHPFPVNSLEFWMDGEDISHKVQYSDSKANITLHDLSEGKHVLWIGFRKNYNPLTLVSASISRSFDVDTEDPVITLNTPDTKLIMRKELYVMGKTEPDVRYHITVNNETHSGRSDMAGNFYAKVNMDRETNKLRIVTTDKAGNKSKLFRMFILDETAPGIEIAEIPEDERYDNNRYEDEEKTTGENKEGEKVTILRNNSVTLKAEVFDTGSGVKDCWFEIDGEKMKGEYNPESKNLTIDLKGLDEGEYSVKVLAEDHAGWKSQKEWSFIVDSREEPGNFKIRPGALGHDVEIVQGKLKKMGYLNEVTGKFGKETKEAVMKVQKKMNLPVTGIMDKETFLAISEKINIYLGDFTLHLLSPDGKLVKKYPIACGSPYYPTPPGDYFVREKVYHPAWYPPPSPWARGAKPIPPGPGNPLGTRWIGLNAEIVGIHGTPSSWSIGSASSHGCIRMYIPDVEELFELVSVGTPVSIYSHTSPSEKEKELKKPGQKDDGNNTGGQKAGGEENI